MTSQNSTSGDVNNELVIDVTPSEIVIACLKDKQLIELSKEKSNLQFAVGDVYLGIVRKIIPGLNAAFVDIGYGKDAFLHYLDLGPQLHTLIKYVDVVIHKKGKAPSMQRFQAETDIDKKGKIEETLQMGQQLLVQVAKEPISTKGPRLTSEISIAGRNIVLLPFSEKISISQKISSIDEKKRLRLLIQSIKPKNYGVIVRTVAEGKSHETLEEELRELVSKWNSALDDIKLAKAPRLFMSEMNRTSTILRDILNASFSNIYVNDEHYYNQIKEYLATIAPETAKILKLVRGSVPIFDKYGISKQIKSLFGRTVSIRNGAYLVIEHTEALHVIDVNSGTRTKFGPDQETNTLEVNLLAAQHIAMQLRLRDMGGIIVIDFIDMYNSEHRTQLLETMREAMSEDRARHNILPISKFGLMQITRQRVRPELSEHVVEKCPVCRGSGEISPSILFDDELFNNLSYIVEQGKYKSVIMRIHPYIASYLTKGFISMRLKWVLKLRCKIKLVPDSSLSFLDVKYFNRVGEEILR